MPTLDASSRSSDLPWPYSCTDPNCRDSPLKFEISTYNIYIVLQVRKRGMRCRSSNPRVIKTIRLRRAGLEPWVHKTNIKVVTSHDDDDSENDNNDIDFDHDQVVHLVRDPRAIINSVSKR